MDAFYIRDQLVEGFRSYIRSFVDVRDERLKAVRDDALSSGLFWPEPLLQLNPNFAPGGSVPALVREGLLHRECEKIFQAGKTEASPVGKPLRLYKHQVDAIRAAKAGRNYVLTTGTGSGKSLSYILPIVDRVLQQPARRRIRAIVVYPMNALANSQLGELRKFLEHGYGGRSPVTFARFTGQEREEERERIKESPPDILLTNYVMLELMLTRPHDKEILRAAEGLEFLVFDELHTYRGRQGADVSLLIRRTRDRLRADRLQCIGTSATLAGPGTLAAQRAEVARVASTIFGAPFAPEDIIAETLERATPGGTIDGPALRDRIDRPVPSFAGYQDFVQDPLARWLEGQIGIVEDKDSGRLVRALPLPIRGQGSIAARLSEYTGAELAACEKAIRDLLLASYAERLRHPETYRPPFAFRLHQFLSPGWQMNASPEPQDVRYVTMHEQQFVPGSNREKVLLPVVFCMECGQDYFAVKRSETPQGAVLYVPREMRDRGDEHEDVGYLYLRTDDDLPREGGYPIERLPEEWTEEAQGKLRVVSARRNDVPRPVRIDAAGCENADGQRAWFIPTPFRLCLHCGVAYSAFGRSEAMRLSSLNIANRSTATTLVSLLTVRMLRLTQDLPAQARKLLSFTDNRQDASLQAGHFNDFIQVGLVRAALYRAVHAAGPEGLHYEHLANAIFDALALPFAHYATEPDLRFGAAEETRKALRRVLEYLVYRDLKPDWRPRTANLEEAGLLRVDYLSFDEMCADEAFWRGCDPILERLDVEHRSRLVRTVLDHLRQLLAVKIDVLTSTGQEVLQRQSVQRLVDPWALDEDEKLVRCTYVVLRSRGANEFGEVQALTSRGSVGTFLRTMPAIRSLLGSAPTSAQITELLKALVERLSKAGLVEHVATFHGTPAYQVPASVLVWRVGDGKSGLVNPLRMPRLPESGKRVNPFFVRYYREMAEGTLGLEAREHTAQVPSDEREAREKRFQEADLPILYCSPTMELGVDVAQLNVVHMRNVPPTPANYAQRSGRAGRSGQPALVISYCAYGSNHDRYFFQRQDRMVAGQVAPPRLDLGNEDLVRAHMHAIWLAETGASLGKSLSEVVSVEAVDGKPPHLDILPGVLADLENPDAMARADGRCRAVLATIENELRATRWYSDDWLSRLLQQARRQFEEALSRWRNLFRSADSQRQLHYAIWNDRSRPEAERNRSRRLHDEAIRQGNLLLDVNSAMQSDFYSYRYFASEGFLPGYNFPRLPLSAFIPGSRRAKKGHDDYVARPRFLAITEFAPRALIYHEGARYRVDRVLMRVANDVDGQSAPTVQAKHCPECGYFHPHDEHQGVDVCEHCHTQLTEVPPIDPLFQMQNVAARRVDRITSSEEERQRHGYDVLTGIRFADHGGGPVCRTSVLSEGGEQLLLLTHGDAATIRRVNLGLKRRKRDTGPGFVLDLEKGLWGRESDEESDDQDPVGPRTLRVIPFVEDRKNCLVARLPDDASPEFRASLRAALKSAIQVEFQLEDMELAAEAIPDRSRERRMLFYEATEGGAGVLRRLLDEPDAFARVAKKALELCHFDPTTGDDRRRAPHGKEDCEAACYDCLRSYGNQPEHALLDRKLIRDFLLRLARGEAATSPAPVARNEHLETLLAKCESDLEKTFLHFLERHRLRLPSAAQRKVTAASVRPDFLYEQQQAVVYVDGPVHDFPERHRRDAAQQQTLEDLGVTVIRFHHEADWSAVIRRYPDLFGKL